MELGASFCKCVEPQRCRSVWDISTSSACNSVIARSQKGSTVESFFLAAPTHQLSSPGNGTFIRSVGESSTNAGCEVCPLWQTNQGKNMAGTMWSFWPRVDPRSAERCRSRFPPVRQCPSVLLTIPPLEFCAIGIQNGYWMPENARFHYARDFLPASFSSSHWDWSRAWHPSTSDEWLQHSSLDVHSTSHRISVNIV